MSTQMRNTGNAQEIKAFLHLKPNTDPLPFTYALADGIREFGDSFLKTDNGKCLLHVLNSIAHGREYRLDGTKERDRLETIFRE